jgi:hypothetical protein
VLYKPIQGGRLSRSLELPGRSQDDEVSEAGAIVAVSNQMCFVKVCQGVDIKESGRWRTREWVLKDGSHISQSLRLERGSTFV